MIQSAQTSGTAEAQVLHLFEGIVKALPADCVTLTRSEGKYFTDIVLQPANRESAEFGVLIDEPNLYAVFFGRSKFFTQFECPWEIKLGRSDGLDRELSTLEKMCLAVIAGRCEHRRGHLSVRGTIYAAQKDIYRVTDLPKFPFKRRVELIRYAPYHSELIADS